MYPNFFDPDPYTGRLRLDGGMNPIAISCPEVLDRVGY